MNPRCPYKTCAIGRNPNTTDYTVTLLPGQAKQAGINVPQPLFRCGYCDGVWRESAPGLIEPIGSLSLGTPGFTAWEDPAKIELARDVFRRPTGDDTERKAQT